MVGIIGLVRVRIRPGQEVREIEAASVESLLKELGLHRDAHLVIRKGEILTADVRLKPDDEVEVIPVISGGAFA